MDKTNDDMRKIEDDNVSEDVASAASATRLVYEQQMKEYERLQALQHKRAKQENPSGGRSEENISLKPLSTDVCISHKQSESSTSNNKFSSQHSAYYELQRREYQRLNQAHNLRNRNSMRSQPQNNLASCAASSTETTSQYANLITDEQLKYYQDIFDNVTSLSSTGATAARSQTSSTQQQFSDLSSYADNNANANGEHKEEQLKSPPEMLMRRNRKEFE